MELNVRCPRCGRCLPAPADEATSITCFSAHTFPVICGIPDLRESTAPTCWADARTIPEAELVGRMALHFHTSSLEALVNEYVCALRLPLRLKEATRSYMLEAHLREAWGVKYMEFCHIRNSRSWLQGKAAWEAGCGAGGSVLHLVGRFEQVVGTDVDLAALLVAKKRCELQGVRSIILIAAALEQDIFSAETFDAIKCTDVLEHVEDPGLACVRLASALNSSGMAFVLTPNKWSFVTPEPHVRLWGVQFLPARLADRYVAWRIGIPYRNVARLMSYGRFLRILKATGLRVVFVPFEDKHLNPTSRRGRLIKLLFDRSPLRWMSAAMRYVQPSLEAVCFRVADRASHVE